MKGLIESGCLLLNPLFDSARESPAVTPLLHSFLVSGVSGSTALLSLA